MLKNISEGKVRIQWNGMAKDIMPGEVIDTVELFGEDLERRLMAKNPGKLTRVEPTPFIEEIKEQEAKIEPILKKRGRTKKE